MRPRARIDLDQGGNGCADLELETAFLYKLQHISVVLVPIGSCEQLCSGDGHMHVHMRSGGGGRAGVNNNNKGNTKRQKKEEDGDADNGIENARHASGEVTARASR